MCPIGIFKIIQDIAEDSNSYLSPNNITISGFNLLSACVVLFNDIAIALADKLEAGLKDYDLAIERDRNLKDKTIIGFFIYIEYFDKIIRKALSQAETSVSEPADEE